MATNEVSLEALWDDLTNCKQVKPGLPVWRIGNLYLYANLDGAKGKSTYFKRDTRTRYAGANWRLWATTQYDQTEAFLELSPDEKKKVKEVSVQNICKVMVAYHNKKFSDPLAFLVMCLRKGKNVRLYVDREDKFWQLLAKIRLVVLSSVA